MRSYTVKKNSNFQDIENAISILRKYPDIELRLPNQFVMKGCFGIEGLVCQLLATWLKNGTAPKVFHSFQSQQNEDLFDDLSSMLYGIAALRLSDKVLSAERVEVSEELALKKAFDRVRLLNSYEFSRAFKGMYIAFPAIKSKGINREFNSPLYNSENVIGSEGFRVLMENALASILTRKKYSIIENRIPTISEVVRELFENTHLHARRDDDGNLLEFNFRGIIIKSIELTTQRLDELATSGARDRGLTMFCSEWKGWINKNQRNLSILDVTVVDSGPGYINTWLGKKENEVTDPERVKAVIECFSHRASSTGRLGFGIGLPNVIADLKKLHGWFRLRTSSVSVTKSFYKGQGYKTVSESDVSLGRETTEGTSFNFIIPLID